MKSQKIYLLLSSLLITVMSYAQITRYVRPSAMGDGSGSSWQNASDDLQAMINASTSGDKIYVAVGTYVPNRKANDIQTITENNADNSFVLKSGVALYGGFDPDNGNTILGSRRGMPGSETATILSGDMDGDNNGNARHVVIIAGGSGYILDGFIIQQSNASSPPDNNISVNGHTISKNSGGGIYITNTTGSTFISNCWIRGNRSNMGAGVYTNVSVTFTNCIFSGNYTTTNNGSPSYGAGLYNAGNSGSGGWIGTTLINCTFSGNKAGASSNARGGAIYNSGDIIINNSIIYGNSSAGNQNGIHNNGGNVQTYKSLIGDSSQTTTTENTINGNPGFLNAPSADNAPFIIGDYKLNANSAAVNVGNNLWISSMSIDIQGLNRLNGTVDLGAHEREASYLNYTRYVKPSATGLGDGSSWANASDDLQEMINNSISGDMIFVAGGTYKPNRKANALFTITPNNRDNAFVLKNGVKIYGNFAGTENSLAQRNLSNTANKSILSGDFNGNDAVSGSGSSLAISNNGENAYHVVIASGASSENPIAPGTILDGFTIKGGNANSYMNSITVNGKTVDRGMGGGLSVASGSHSSPTIANCIFTENRGAFGGAVSIMGLYSSSAITFTNCVFSKNLGSTGGAFNVYRSTKLTNCTVWGNRASQGGTAFVNLPTGDNFTIQNSIVYGNSNGIRTDSGTTAVTHSLVQGESSTANGNISGNLDPMFVASSQGDFRLQFLSPARNRGNNDLVLTNITTDISGNIRIQDCAVDLGAYENDPLPPPVAENQNCYGETLMSLTAEGENLKWYDVTEGGSPLSMDTQLVDGYTYYVSQTINDCESPRTAIQVSYQTESPLAPSPQNFTNSGIPVTALEAFGENLKWYNEAIGGVLLTHIFQSGIYYVSQTIEGCESAKTSVVINISNTTRYVKSEASGIGDGSSWDNASDDLQAMINASSNGDYIFVSGGTYKPNRKANALFTITPNNRDNAFVLKNGVKIYGNFAGTESSLAQRDLSNTANKSILSGDFNGNDAVSGSGSSLAISNNGENAYHVVIASGASSENPIAPGTILDGFTIKGGNANSYMNSITVNGKTVNRGLGGGLIVASGSHSSPTIANCIFTQNYGAYGGAVSISGLFSSSAITFTNCVFSKNLGSTGGAFNVYRSMKLTNCTVWGNRASQGEAAFVNLPIAENFTIQNSIVYGNSSGIRTDSGTTAVTYSLVQGQSSTANGNINGSTNPLFTNASGGDFRLQMTSPVINKGNNSYVSNITADISGNPRIQLGTVDLGAYESEKYGTIWTTSNNWLNNVEPDIEKDVFIEGDLHVGTDYFGFSAKSLTVEETGSITIEAENIVTIKEAIINKAQATDFVVENDGIVLQTDEAENQGDITVFRNSNPMKRLDYTLWTSPVAGMLLKDFSQVSPSGGYGTLWNRVYILGETAWEQIWDSYAEVESSTSTFAQAKGYLYRSRNDYHPTETQIFEGEFIGIPHNGTITASTPYVFNAVGNPYPSPMSADDFIMSNPGVNALYFWTNVNAPVDGSYTLNNWAYYTLMGGTGVRINGEGEQFYIPDGTIQTGQGFLVGTSGSVPQVTFNNSMRVVENGAFFRQMSSEKHRFWLNLSNEEALLNQILIGYVENATQGFDSGIDAEMFGYNGNAIYSLVENSEENYVIQGRALPFTANDVVSLGLRVLNPGSYSISLNDFDGVFEDENQAIYLKDNLHQLYHNLKDGAYTFLSENGTFKNRFEIVYQEMMSTENPITQNANWVIYPYDKGFKIQTDGFEMKQVIVYDLLGREIYTAKAEGNTHQIPSLGADSVYIVKVVTTEDEMLSKKVR